MPTDNTPATTSTTDLYMAAYLKVSGVPFLGTTRDGNRVTFLFEDIPSLKDLKQKYFNRTACVPALTLGDEIKTLKAMTFSS